MNSVNTSGIILDVIAAVILLSFISSGRKKGGVRAILELLSFVITVMAVMIFKDVVTEFILGLEPVANWIEKLTEQFKGPMPELVDMILPPDAMASTLVSIIVNAVSFVVTYFIVKFVLKTVLEITDIITSIPIIRTANRLIGSVVGGVKGVVVIWLLMAVMLLFTATELYSMYTSALADSTLTKILYNNNLLFSLFK